MALIVLFKNILSNALKYQIKGTRTQLHVKLKESNSNFTFQ
jgi:signal transduction histidine kinase